MPALCQEIKNLPIISPHGHTDPAWFANNKPFGNPAALLLQPDHCVFRMLHSQGISLESIGIVSKDLSVAVEQKEKRTPINSYDFMGVLNLEFCFFAITKTAYCYPRYDRRFLYESLLL
ncbi:glucuronate isomerase, partial [Endozoicomonas sp.]|uniref:glucuronate isomerase n=1 Tax=Endozoicomonas sp. TaxID=1892382 RepID=UPI00383AB8A4